jgi:hypothetical protein
VRPTIPARSIGVAHLTRKSIRHKIAGLALISIRFFVEPIARQWRWRPPPRSVPASGIWLTGPAGAITGKDVEGDARLIEMPGTLVRYFKREEHARQFISGQIRFGLLDSYRTVEDRRKDETEGCVSFYWNKKAPQIVIENGRIVAHAESDQNIHYSGPSINPHFVLCTSHPDADPLVLKEKFGRIVVSINDPATLLSRIKNAWANHAWAFEGCAFVAPVVYNKGELLEPNPGLVGPPEYSYSQKPRVPFQEEREYRYILLCSIDTKRALTEHLFLTIPDCSDILALEERL